MKALILAAGRGSRISRYIEGRPKCSVNIGGITLIEDTISKLNNQGINEIALVLGYQAGLLKNLLSKNEINFFYNPFFDITNSIASLWFARDYINADDFLIMNGDVYFEEVLLKQIITEKVSPVLFADETKKEEADYKFYYQNGLLMKYGKDLQGEEITGEYIGVSKLNQDFIPVFKRRLKQLIENQQHNLWWEDVIYSFAKEMDVFVRDVNGSFWAEVDYLEDYQKILNHRKGVL